MKTSKIARRCALALALICSLWLSGCCESVPGLLEAMEGEGPNVERPQRRSTRRASPRKKSRAGQSSRRSAAGAVRTVYQHDGPHEGHLLGVDSKRRSVLFERHHLEHTWALDTISLDSGRRLSTWKASARGSGTMVRDERYAFKTITGDLKADRARYAGFLARTGSCDTSINACYRHLMLAVSPDDRWLLYRKAPTNGRDGDWLYLADRDGENERRLDAGVRASHAPVFSPRADRVAWRGCLDTRDVPRRAREEGSLCHYFLFLSSLDGPPKPFFDLKEPSSYVWSREGETLIVLARLKKEPRRCLWAVDAERRGEPRRILCPGTKRNFTFVDTAQGGRTLVVISTPDPGSIKDGDDHDEASWISWPSSEVVHTRALPRASSSLSYLLKEDGRLVYTHSHKGESTLYVHEADSDEPVAIPLASRPYLVGGLSTNRADTDELVLLSRRWDGKRSRILAVRLPPARPGRRTER